MGSVPHSGNACSALCQPGCPHLDCWQCAEEREKHDALSKASKIAQLDQALRKTLPGASILGGLTAMKPEDWQKATITRGILEGLAEKAGIRMDWNNGHPIFHDADVQAMDNAYRRAEADHLAEKVKELERIAKLQSSGALTARAANAMAAAAANQMDSMVSDVIKQKVEQTFKSDIASAEEAAIQRLRDAGASDADIEAARELAGWKPEGMELAATPVLPPENIRADAVLQRMKQEIEAMKARGITSGTYMVHPDLWKDLAEEAAKPNIYREIAKDPGPQWKVAYGGKEFQSPDKTISYVKFPDLAVSPDVDKT